MDIHAAYRETGSYRAAAEICGTTHKTVRRSVERQRRSDAGEAVVRHNYDSVVEVVVETVARTKGRISAKRLLPVAMAAGYVGSDRNFRRLVAEAKAEWRSANHRGRRPGVWAPGETLVFDWGEIGPLYAFCAVSAWSRFRFVTFADNLGAEATMTALAECFERMGGVPKTALTDRMGCLKGGTVAGLVIPTPAYVRFATHYDFRPDFCEGADPESKGLVENLVGYVKSDLMIPEELSVSDLATANAKGRHWCDEVNAAVHSEICAIPAERLTTERELLSPLPSLRAQIGKTVTRKVDRLSCVRFGSARYSVPNTYVGRTLELRVRDGVITIVSGADVIAEHLVVSPGESSVNDDHYGGSTTRTPTARPAKEHRRAGLLRTRPGGRGLHQGGGGPGDDRSGPGPVRLGPARGHPRSGVGHCCPGASGCLRSFPGGRRRLHPQLATRPASPDPAGRRPDRRPPQRAHPVLV
jgi:hypothetical protein